jgi:transcriptional regulator with XRE-family HTH domain
VDNPAFFRHNGNMPMFAVKIGSAIRKKRLSLGLSQEALAALAGLNRTYVGEIERGVVDVSAVNLQHIANALGIKLSDLIRFYEEEDD